MLLSVLIYTDMAGCLITVLVLFGQHTRARPVSFVPNTNPEETQKAMLTAILSVFSDKLPPKSSLILQIRDDEWGGMFVDLISQEILDKSVVKVLVDDSRKQVSDILLGIQELKEDIKDCNDRILFKEKRCEAASGVKNYKLCDNLSEEIVALKSRRREFEAELKVFERKEQKSKWYHKKKSHSSVAHSSESESDSFSHPTTPMSRSRSSTPIVSSDSEHSIRCVSLSSVLGSSSVSSKGTDCREFSPPCGSPLFSPVITAKSGVHQGGGFSQELLPHPTSGHDPQRPLSPSSRGSTMVISSDSEVPTSPSAPDYPPLKRSFAIHPGVSSVDSDSELQSSSNLPSSDLVQSFLEGLPVTTLNRAPQGGQ